MTSLPGPTGGAVRAAPLRRKSPQRTANWMLSPRCTRRHRLAGEPSKSRHQDTAAWVPVGRTASTRESDPGLFDGARAGNEYINQPLGALLPIRAGRHIGNANQGVKQID